MYPMAQFLGQNDIFASSFLILQTSTLPHKDSCVSQQLMLYKKWLAFKATGLSIVLQ